MILLLTGSRTVLFPLFPSLYGWGRGDPTPPGSGTQSWLFCPLISLGLAVAESRLGVPPYSTGNREQVPSEQSQFWTTHALPIIRAHADHFHSLDRSPPAAVLLQSWEGGHLDMSMIAVWLSDAVTQFRQGVLHTLLHLLPLSHHLLTPLCPVTPLTLLFLPQPQPIHCCSSSQSASVPFCLSAAFNCPCFRDV